MADAPRFRCPRCGRLLHSVSGTTCPDCGFLIEQARSRHRSAVNVWHWLQARHRLAYVLIFVWLLLAIVAVWAISWSPSAAIIVLNGIAFLLMFGLSNYLLRRRKRG